METKRDRNQKELELQLQEMATRKVVKLKAFYTHMFLYIVGMIIYILKEYFGVPFNFFPLKYINGFVMCIWTIAFLVSAIDLFVSFKLFGQEWEERKLKSILEKKTKTQKWE